MLFNDTAELVKALVALVAGAAMPVSCWRWLARGGRYAAASGRGNNMPFSCWTAWLINDGEGYQAARGLVSHLNLYLEPPRNVVAAVVVALALIWQAE